MAGYAFDAQYYLSTYPDVAAAVSRGQFASAEDHYNQFGRFEGRDPNQFFDTSFYLSEYPDVTNAGVNPLTHFLTFGSTEARVTNANIEATLDLNNNGSLGDDFNSDAYLAQYPDVAAAVAAGQTTAISHFLQFGQFEGRVATLTNGTTVTGPLTNTGGVSASVTALTTGIDTLTGTAGNDAFRGDNTTVQAGDTINGGAGRDTFSYTDSSAVGVNPTLTTNSVEVINVRNIAGNAGTTPATESATAAFGPLANGQTIVLGGVTVTAGSSGATAAEVVDAFLNGTNTNATVSGTLTGYTVSAGPSANSVTFTSTIPDANVTPDLANSGTGAAVVTVSQGSAGTSGVQPTATVDAANFVGATDFVSDNSTGAVTFSNLAQGQTVSVNGNALSATGAVTATYATAATAATINLANTVGAATLDLNGTGLTTATINSTTGANSVGIVDLDGATAKTININASTAFTSSGIATSTADSTLNISGAGKVTLGTVDSLFTTINATGTSGGVTLTAATGGAVKFTGGTGADSIVFGAGFTSADVVDGGAGRDTVSLNGADFTAANSDGLKGLNALTGVEVLEFTGTSTTISGGTAATSFTNSTVDQLLFNTSGLDTVNLSGARLYSFGADNTGDAAFNLGSGVNTVNLSLEATSAAGADVGAVAVTANAAAPAGQVATVNLASNGLGTITNTTGVLTVAAGSTINVTGSHDLTIAGLGNGGTLDASTFTGKLTATGSTVNDIINGGSNNDTLSGAAGIDTINGGAGNDTITGGTGADILTGGAGADIFKFAAGDSAANGTTFDTITDFAKASDVIDHTASITFVTNATASAGVAAINAEGIATFNAADTTLAQQIAAVEAGINAGGTEAAGQAAIFQSGSDSYVFISDGTNGVGANDVLIKLTGVTGLTDSTLTSGGDLTIA